MATALQDDPQDLRPRGAPETGRAPRWTLSRAGIINVYQYGEETLEFGGGRLLLRGVNGSGKSTAMNMLLPFLLDGDTRRIDAAGEQQGVLRSWMLSGRDESSQQPVGYLWVEVEKNGEHLCFGCGIRASRATEAVSTWWFVTSRRIGIDLRLVEGRQPVSREVLKTLITPEPVYGQEQRAEYRNELSRRLFGGADIEEHLHLLRIVRNPRVGDRLDTELPQYLQNALPSLSEGALDDAAQPLEDLEEHRKNVADLKRTAEALEAIQGTYRNYARTELHRFAERTGQAISAFRKCAREEEQAREAHTLALTREHGARERKKSLESDIERHLTGISALKDSDAYKSGAELNDLRAFVARLKRTEQETAVDLRHSQDKLERATVALREAHGEADREHRALARTLANLGAAASHCRLTARPPAAAALGAHADSPPDLPLAPAAPVETQAAERDLALLADATRGRIGEVDGVEAAVRLIEPAEGALRTAEAAVEQARAAQEAAGGALSAARLALQASVTAWQGAVAAWLERLQEHHTAHGLGAVGRPSEVGRVVDEILLDHRVTDLLDALISPTIEHHERRRADTQAALRQQQEIVAQLAEKARELAARQLPDPPLLPWQQRTGRCLAELVDFRESLDPVSRAGLEAALEASGLLSAEVQADGTLQLASGQLIVTPGAGQVAAPLSAFLAPDVPKDGGPDLPAAVTRILAGISTDPTSDAATLVTVEGGFRVGPLRGRLMKAEAEHIGLTARRAALERARAEAARQLAEAQGQCGQLAARLSEILDALAQAKALRHDIPSEQELHTRLWARDEAERVLERALEQLEARRNEHARAAEKHAAAVAHAEVMAARLVLPTALGQLAALREDLRRILSDCADARRELSSLRQAVERWRRQGEDWQREGEEEAGWRERLASARGELLTQQERLDTLNARIGASYEQVIADIRRSEGLLSEARGHLKGCEQDLDKAVGDVSSTEAKREAAASSLERANTECVKTLVLLRQALLAPGLTEAATGRSAEDGPDSTPAPVAFPAVEDSVPGARVLVEAIRGRVPAAAEPTSAESVRKSIRARRDSLGAGWDAEDRQPDPELPLSVEVTGSDAQQAPLPAAAQAVREQLTRLENLLSAKQQQALRNLLQGLVAREIADKMHAAQDMIGRMNARLSAVTTSHGIGVRLQWRLRDDLDPTLAPTIALLAKTPDLRTAEEDQRLAEGLGARINEARREDPGTPYRELIARVLDYREWHRMKIYVLRPGKDAELLSRRTALSEGEKKMVTYLPLFSAVAASCDGLAAIAPDALRFLLLDDAFNKVSEDNHGKLFGLLVELDLDFIVTSERLWGTHDTVPELAITEVIRDSGSQTIVLEHSHWDGRRLELVVR